MSAFKRLKDNWILHVHTGIKFKNISEIYNWPINDIEDEWVATQMAGIIDEVIEDWNKYSWYEMFEEDGQTLDSLLSTINKPEEND